MHRCCDTTGWIWLAPARWQAEGRPKILFLSLPGSHSSWTPEREWTSMRSSHCTTKRIPPGHPALLCSSRTARAKCSPCLGSRTASPWAIPRQGACTSARAFTAGSEAAQNELAYALYYTRGKTHQKKNWRLPSQLALGTTQKVCRENLQGSFSSSHKTNFKNNEPPV